MLPTVHQSNSHPVECIHHPDKELLIAQALSDMYTQQEYSKFSFNIVPCYRAHTVTNITTLPPEMRQTCHNMKHGVSDRCHFPEFSGSVSNSNHELQDFMACPVNYKVDFDELRTPSHIAMAVCECRHCYRGRCIPIFSYLPVVMAECNMSSAFFEYRKSILEVPVGCACVNHRLAGSHGNTHRRHSSRRRIVMEQ